MTYSSPYVYLRVLGHFGSSGTDKKEIWGVGMKIPFPLPGPSEATLSAFLETCAVPISAYHSNSSVGAGNRAFLTELTGAFIGTDGKYVGGGLQSTQHYVLTPLAGAGTSVYNFTTACVLSLRTDKARGYASNGRIYWPAMALAIDTTSGMFSNTTQVAIAAKTMLDGINGAAGSILGSGRQLAVMSNVGAGEHAFVRSVRVGSKQDRQERREKQIVELYEERLLAAGALLDEDRVDVPIGHLGRR